MRRSAHVLLVVAAGLAIATVSAADPGPLRRDAGPQRTAAREPTDAIPSDKPEPEKAEKRDAKPLDKPADGNAADTKPPDTKASAKPEAKAPAGSPILTLKLAFMNDERLFPYDIDVDMKGETVALSGKVSSEDDKRAAAEITQRLTAGKTVKNEVEVSKELLKSLARRRDEAITQYVKERFARSKTLETAHFDVKTTDGVVTLAGKTRFQVIVLEAAEAARQVPGVRAVNTDGIVIEGAE